ncbi:hypothetical protein ACFQ8E_12930 [Isoptericola sp. NPDC056573]
MKRIPTARTRSQNVWKFLATIVVILAAAGAVVVALPLLLSLGADL